MIGTLLEGNLYVVVVFAGRRQCHVVVGWRLEEKGMIWMLLLDGDWKGMDPDVVAGWGLEVNGMIRMVLFDGRDSWMEIGRDGSRCCC